MLARSAGVELVHQSFALPPSFTVAEAMEFGATGKGALYSRKALEARWAKHLAALGIKVRTLVAADGMGSSCSRASRSPARW